MMSSICDLTCGYDGGRRGGAADLSEKFRLVPVAVTDLAVGTENICRAISRQHFIYPGNAATRGYNGT